MSHSHGAPLFLDELCLSPGSMNFLRFWRIIRTLLHNHRFHVHSGNPVLIQFFVPDERDTLPSLLDKPSSSFFF